MSAERSASSRVEIPGSRCTRPTLTVQLNGCPLQVKCRSWTVLRRWSAISTAFSAGQFSSRMPNSSPPSRASVSPSRKPCCSRVQTWRSSSSPAAWPQVSLTSLNWSRSRNIRACRPLLRSRRSSAICRRYSNSRRLVSPVNASWVACQDRRAMYWRSRVMS